MSKIGAIIVDDEVKSRTTLKSLVERYCDEVDILGMAESVDQAIRLVKQKHPDLVFLDIEMPEKNGFEFLDKTPSGDFDVIFTTAYDSYALKAIKYSAADYLLKPIDIEELVEAVEKVRQNEKRHQNQDQFHLLLTSLKEAQKPKRIALPTGKGLQFIEIDNIIRLESEGSYTTFFIKDQSKIIASKNLKEYEDLLISHNFIRIHHSHIINVDFIKEYVRGDGNYVVMEDGTTVTISRRKKDEFLKRILNK